jgi:hypothetical protein
MTTKKHALADLLNAPSCTATQEGGRTLEDWPAMCAEFRARIEALGGRVTLALPYGDRMEGVLPHRPAIADSIVKPKLPRVRVGTFAATATLYTFSWKDQDNAPRERSGKLADLKLQPDGTLRLEMLIPGVSMVYRANTPEMLPTTTEETTHG